MKFMETYIMSLISQHQIVYTYFIRIISGISFTEEKCFCKHIKILSKVATFLNSVLRYCLYNTWQFKVLLDIERNCKSCWWLSPYQWYDNVWSQLIMKLFSTYAERPPLIWIKRFPRKCLWSPSSFIQIW